MVKFPSLVNLSFVLLAAGCGQDGIGVYTVPKEPAAPMAKADLPAGHPDLATTAAPQLQWKLPDGWNEGAPSEFRLASFKIKGENGKEADVSVIPLPGGAGGDLSNVNRWRGQVGLPPISEDELKRLAESAAVAGQPATLFELGGESSRILAAIQHRDGTAWFFKMTGDSQLVAQQKPVFVEFLKSVQFAAAPEPAAAAAGPKWDVPADWQEVPGGQFLVAKFAIAGGASVNVSTSVGDGGGLAANVNRWRKQLGLSELSNDELSRSVKTIGDQAALVEMNGQDARSGQPAALVGAIVLQPGQAWFYKLMGDAKVVAVQKDAFIKFVQEVKY